MSHTKDRTILVGVLGIVTVIVLSIACGFAASMFFSRFFGAINGAAIGVSFVAFAATCLSMAFYAVVGRDYASSNRLGSFFAGYLCGLMYISLNSRLHELPPGHAWSMILLASGMFAMPAVALWCIHRLHLATRGSKII